mmetsp:Transcript_19100/g.53052  ORF Transcript_19100/g.53052 Transcript_19100/m.53052 type:complete len:266 (-) Transcript_19100:199-996(-)
MDAFQLHIQKVHQLHQGFVASQHLNLFHDLRLEDAAFRPRVLQAAVLDHQALGVLLDVNIFRAFLQYGKDSGVIRVAPDGVDDGKTEFALGEVLAEALRFHVLVVGEVDVVVTDLKVQCEVVHQRGEVAVLHVRRECLHQPDGQTEQAPGLVFDHLEVLLFRGASHIIAPQDVVALPAVQIEQLAHEHIHRLRITQRMALLQCQKICVVRRIDDGGNAEDRVRHRDSPSQLAVVFDVIDHERGIVQIANDILDLVENFVRLHLHP